MNNIPRTSPDEIVYLNSLEAGDRTKQVLKANTVKIREEEETPLAKQTFV